MTTTFQEYCDRCSNEVEQAIVAWHGSKYISGIQLNALIRYNYPLGGFSIMGDLLLVLSSIHLISTSHPQRIEQGDPLDGFRLLRDEIYLNGFYSSYEHVFTKCEIAEQENVFIMMKEDLLEYCINIIRNTCEFGG